MDLDKIEREREREIWIEKEYKREYYFYCNGRQFSAISGILGWLGGGMAWGGGVSPLPGSGRGCDRIEKSADLF